MDRPFQGLTVRGSYALFMRMPGPLTLSVGKLGEWDFPGGDYLYLGSAHGPGGLSARLEHHARQAEHPHWHIDWLRPHALLLGAWAVVQPTFPPDIRQTSLPGGLECRWSQAVLRIVGAQTPVPGFGSADCRMGCRAHLVFLSPGTAHEMLESVLQNVLAAGEESSAMLQWIAYSG